MKNQQSNITYTKSKNKLNNYIKLYFINNSKDQKELSLFIKWIKVFWCESLISEIIWEFKNFKNFYSKFRNEIKLERNRLTQFTWKRFKKYKWYMRDFICFSVNEVIQRLD